MKKLFFLLFSAISFHCLAVNLNIESSQTWMTGYSLPSEIHSITVTNNATLIIIGLDINLMTDGFILVKTGSSLKIDNSHLKLKTTELGTWNGIIVEGNNILPQSLLNHSQGYLRISRSYIQDTKEHSIFVQGGGILFVTNTEFFYHENAIYFDLYNYNNCSRIIDCVFNFGDENYYTNKLNAMRAFFLKHVILYQISGVRIIGCEFKGCRRQMSRLGSLLVERFGTGIYATNSSFNVQADDAPLTITNCYPDGSQSKFIELLYGIQYSNTQLIVKEVNIVSNLFINVFKSIEGINCTGSIIFNNTFTYSEIFKDNPPFFIYLEGSKVFEILYNKLYFRLHDDTDLSCYQGIDLRYIHLKCPVNYQNRFSKVHNNYIYFRGYCSQGVKYGIFLEQCMVDKNEILKIYLTCNKFNNVYPGETDIYSLYRLSHVIFVEGLGQIPSLGCISSSSGNQFYHSTSHEEITYRVNPNILQPIYTYYLDVYHHSSDLINFDFFNKTEWYINIHTASDTAYCFGYDPCNYIYQVYDLQQGENIIDMIQSKKIWIIEKEETGDICLVYDPNIPDEITQTILKDNK